MIRKFILSFILLFAASLGLAQSSGSGSGSGTGNGTTSTSNSGAAANITMNNAAPTPTIQTLPGVMGGPLFPAMPMTNGQWIGYRPAVNYAVTEEAARLMAGKRNHHCIVTPMAVSNIAANDEPMTYVAWWPDYVQSSPDDQVLATVDCQTAKFREPLQAALGSALAACKKATNTNRVAVRFRDIVTGVTKGFSIGGSGAVSPMSNGNPTAYAAGGFIGTDKAHTEDSYEVQVYCMNKGPLELPPPPQPQQSPVPAPAVAAPAPVPAPATPEQSLQVAPHVMVTPAPVSEPTAAPSATAQESMPPLSVLFDFGKADVHNADLSKIKQYATWIIVHSNDLIGVEGFTDKVGTVDYNAALGMQRSDVVYRLLVADGVPQQQLKKLSGGKSSPAGDWDAANRRVILQILGPQSDK
jgi:outer membrane protein OmpA-like peptidoglycan-associated protein